MNYPFEKNEYNYYATILIFGLRSPKLSNFSAYALPVFQSKKNLAMVEQSSLNKENHLETTRTLSMDETRYVVSSHTNMKSGINNIITYVDHQFGLDLSDQIFEDRDFEYYEQNWDACVMNKIRSLGILVRALHEKRVVDIPLMAAEYLNISKALFERADFWGIEQKEGLDAIHG